MQTIKWSQDMSLGVGGMDVAHKEFLDDLTELLTVPDDQFAPAFMQMIDTAEKGFRAEEELMEAIDFPGLHEHREQHARVLGALHHVAPHVMGGDIELGREAADLLPQWFLHHLSTMDTALAFALDLHESGQNPPAIRPADERTRQDSGR